MNNVYLIQLNALCVNEIHIFNVAMFPDLTVNCYIIK